MLKDFEEAAVLDRETGLVRWRAPQAEQPDPTGTSNQGAALHCANSRVGGRMGWRLPTLDEMLTLARTDQPPGGNALPEGHPFDVDPMLRFWTQSQVVGGSTVFFLAQFQDDGGNDPSAPPPFVILSVVSSNYFVWCVRGPGAGTTAGVQVP